MTIIDVLAILIGVVGVLFGVRSYLELWRWARQCQRAQIAVAYKGRVKMSYPLVEWLLWCNRLKDSEVNGRVVFSHNGVSVAVVRGRTESPRNKVRAALHVGRRRGKTAPPPARVGKWAATDETVKQ